MLEMLIYDEHGQRVETDKMEVYEQHLAEKYVIESDVVLELGARYGSVSCKTNAKLSDRKNHFVVEPDSRVWPALTYNKSINGCDFTIVKGFISQKKLDLTNLHCWFGGYGATAVQSDDSKIPSFPLPDLPFTVLIADCEGGLEDFLRENPKLFDGLRLMIFEADYPDKCDYGWIATQLREHGFVAIESGFQNVWLKN